MAARALHAALPTAASAPVAFASSSSPVFSSSSFLVAWGTAEPTSPWGATVPPAHLVPPAADHPVPPASWEEARALRAALTKLITRERHAAADFLVALADFDQRRGWEALGHRSLFDFLKRELKCSSGAASHRSAAARLIPRFPAVEAALRVGDLCLSSLRHLARVLRPENEADYLPRFYGLSAREAEALAAELLPRAVQPRREVVTLVSQPKAVHTCEQKRPEGVPGQAAKPMPDQSGARPAPTSAPTATSVVADLPLPSGERSEVMCTMPPPTLPPQAPLPTREVQPLSAELRRLHLTVSTRLLGKVESAKAGLAHAMPGATTEQVLEAALDLLLEKQARRKGLVKGPRSSVGTAAGADAGTPAGMIDGTAAGTRVTTPASDLPIAPQAEGGGPGEGHGAELGASPPADHLAAPAALTLQGPAPTRTRHIPSAVRREVWLRDGQRCQYPLDSGDTCGATHRLELDHLVPLALGGPSTADNLRVVCAFHNQAAARAALGAAIMEDQRARARRGT